MTLPEVHSGIKLLILYYDSKNKGSGSAVQSLNASDEVGDITAKPQSGLLVKIST